MQRNVGTLSLSNDKNKTCLVCQKKIVCQHSHHSANIYNKFEVLLRAEFHARIRNSRLGVGNAKIKPILYNGRDIHFQSNPKNSQALSKALSKEPHCYEYEAAPPHTSSTINQYQNTSYNCARSVVFFSLLLCYWANYVYV